MTSSTAGLSTKSWFDKTYEERWSVSSLDQVCEIWELDTARDIPMLLQLKKLLEDLRDDPLNDPLELARCYVDANRKVAAAEQKFRAMVKWRREEGIDSLIEHYHPPSLMEDYYPSCYLQGYDKDGDPIWMDRIGASDAWAVYSRYGHVPFMNYVLRNREVALRGEFARDYEKKRGRPPARITAILDMDGLCLRHLMVGLIPPMETGT
jgi:hypothetical protein